MNTRALPPPLRRPVDAAQTKAPRKRTTTAISQHPVTHPPQTSSPPRIKGIKTHIIRRSNRNTIFLRMPTHMQNLLVEINLIRIRLLPHPLRPTGRTVRSGPLLSSWRARSATGAVHRRWNADLLRLEGRFVCLKDDLGVVARFRRIDHEVVVVGTGHDVLRVTRENDLELVEDGVVFVGVAESRPEVFVDGDRLDWLTLHVDVPDFDSQVITGENVAAVVGEADVGDAADDFGEEGAGGGVFFLFELCVIMIVSMLARDLRRTIEAYVLHAHRKEPSAAYPPT